MVMRHLDIFDAARLNPKHLLQAGVEPNPRVETVRRGAEICRKENVDVILAVGGGSTIDCAKVVAAATKFEPNFWWVARFEITAPLFISLPVAANVKIVTNGNAPPWYFQSMLPKVSFLDPQNTFSVNKYQTAAGSADIMSHLIENYFKRTEGTDVQDSVSEGLMRSVINIKGTQFVLHWMTRPCAGFAAAS
jgi:alcohol dehydrogenase YqhD (iron-dependent ADH family)